MADLIDFLEPKKFHQSLSSDNAFIRAFIHIPRVTKFLMSFIFSAFSGERLQITFRPSSSSYIKKTAPYKEREGKNGAKKTH